MSRKNGKLKLAAVALAATYVSVAMAVTASAASIPTLTKHRDYVSRTSQLQVAFVAHSPTIIDAGRSGDGGSQYDTGGLFFHCPAVSSKALINPGFPQITLKKVHDVYGFSLSYTVDNATAGYPGQNSTTLGQVQVRLTGHVTNASTISGTAQLIGVPCSSSVLTYVAKIDASVTKYLAPNA